jgi:predicted AlkP superfamily pyrophosphatase or phosphodiesterase
MPFDDRFPNDERVKRVLDWLKLPDGTRPSFLTLYFSDVDNAGHEFGPDSPENRNAVLSVDRSVGELVAGVEAAGLSDRVNYVVVSDHGMSALSQDRVIVLDNYIDLASVEVIDWAPVVGVSPKDGNVDQLYAALKDKHPHLRVYRKSEIPPEYGLANHPRVPAVIGIADEGWNIASARDLKRWGAGERTPPGGTHGYDQRAKSMQGLFVAAGPRLRSGMVVEPFENIHIYELMCALLHVTPAKNDGDPAVTRDMLR